MDYHSLNFVTAFKSENQSFDQTNEIKNRYVQSLLNGGKRDSQNSQPAEKVSNSAVSIQPLNSTNNNGQSTALLTDLANLPPELLDLLINKEPTVFAQLVERLLRKKNDSSSSSNFRLINTYENNSNSVNLDSLKFSKPRAPTPPPGQNPYDVNDLDLQADLTLASYENAAAGTNMGGWYTGVGLTLVALVTLLLMLVLCLRHKKRVDADREAADGAKLVGPSGRGDSKASMDSNVNGMNNNNVKVEELLKLETPTYQWTQQQSRPYFYAAQTPTPTGRTLPYGVDPRSNKNLGYLPWLFPANNSQASLYSKTEI
uniref:Uncharacterized protein n=1 Tax=Romanomermis culicivorax TaxID=13658 RepID=A0A915LAA9_ROMCU